MLNSRGKLKRLLSAVIWQKRRLVQASIATNLPMRSPFPLHGATTELLTEIDDPKRVELPPMFSWLSNSIPDYPETLNLQMYAHIKELGERPTFELEPTDHPLSVEYYEGITPERVKEIMMRRLDMPEM